jgi:glycosyltransferase involved in cell wall biosynthesis
VPPATLTRSRGHSARRWHQASRAEPIVREQLCGARSRLEGLATASQDRPLRIALLAPPWNPVDRALALLADALVDRGHQVVLMAAPGSSTKAVLVTPLERAFPREVGDSLVEADYVGRAFEYIERCALEGRPFDLVHDHSGWVALAMADRLPVPLLHTIRVAFDERSSRFYAAHGHKAALTCLSRAQAATRPDGLRVDGIVPDPVDVETTNVPKGDHLLWVGRFSAEDGAHRAIEVARRSGRRLLLASLPPRNERYFASKVQPHVDGDRIRHIDFDPTVLAFAHAVLLPSRSREPFAHVAASAMAAGTPVIAFAHGSAPEIVESGRSGLLVAGEDAMAEAVEATFDPEACRASAVERFAPERIAAAYERLYRDIGAPELPATEVIAA